MISRKKNPILCETESLWKDWLKLKWVARKWNENFKALFNVLSFGFQILDHKQKEEPCRSPACKSELPMKAITVKEIKLISLKLHAESFVFFAICCWWNNYWITKGDFSWIMEKKERAQKYPNFFMYSSYNGIDLFHRITSWRLEKGVFSSSLAVLSWKSCLIIKSNQKNPCERSAMWLKVRNQKKSRDPRTIRIDAQKKFYSYRRPFVARPFFRSNSRLTFQESSPHNGQSQQWLSIRIYAILGINTKLNYFPLFLHR